MDLYGAGALFRQVVEHAGAGVAIGLLLLLVLFGALGYVGKQSFGYLREWLDATAREKDALIRELTSTRAQVNGFLTNHLEHLKEKDTKADERWTVLVETMQATRDTLTEMREDMRKSREDVHRGFGEIFDSQKSMSESVARIEGRLSR